MPAETGIQYFQQVMDHGFRRHDEKVTFYMSINLRELKFSKKMSCACWLLLGAFLAMNKYCIHLSVLENSHKHQLIK
jgi:hypothetical protein